MKTDSVLMTDRERLRRSIQAEKEAEAEEAQRKAREERMARIRRENEERTAQAAQAPSVPQNEVTLTEVDRSFNNKYLFVKTDKLTGQRVGYIVKTGGGMPTHFAANEFRKACAAFDALVSGGRGQEAGGIIQPLPQIIPVH